MKSLLSYNRYEIIAKKELIPDTFLFRFKGLLGFEPGQFVQAYLDHFGESTFVPCSSPSEKKFFELCIRSTGSTTNGIAKLLIGDKLDIRGPYGHGWPFDEIKRQDLVLIAGGIGLVPFRSLLFQILKHRHKFGRIFLFGGFKTAELILFKDDFEIWQKYLTFVEPVVELGDKSYLGKTGLITEPLKDLEIDAKKSLIFMCGPEIMYKFVDEVLISKGVAENQIYISFERRMECGIGVCQHCNIGKYLVCEDGPVFRLDQIKGEVGK